MDNYRRLKELRPDLYRKVIEVSLCITCANVIRSLTDPQEREVHSAAAKAESRAVELLLEAIITRA